MPCRNTIWRKDNFNGFNHELKWAVSYQNSSGSVGEPEVFREGGNNEGSGDSHNFNDCCRGFDKLAI